MKRLNEKVCEEMTGHCFEWYGGYEWCKHCGKSVDGVFDDDIDFLKVLEEHFNH